MPSVMQDAISSASNWGDYVRASVREKQATPWEKAGVSVEPVSRPRPSPSQNPILQSMDASTTQGFKEKRNVDANRGWNKTLEVGRGQRFDILSQEEKMAVRTPRGSQSPNPPARDVKAETFAKQKAYLLGSSQGTRVDYNILSTNHFLEQHFLAPELRPQILRGAEREEREARARAERAERLLKAGSRADYDIVTGELHGDGARKTAEERRAALERAVLLKNRAAAESVHPILQTFGDAEAEAKQKEKDAQEWETLRYSKTKQQPPRYRIREGAGMDLTSGIIKDETILAQAESRVRARNAVRARKHSVEAGQGERGEAEGAAAEARALARLAHHFDPDVRRADMITNVPVEGREGAPIDGTSAAELARRPLWDTLTEISLRNEADARRALAESTALATATAPIFDGEPRTGGDTVGATTAALGSTALSMLSPGRAVDVGPLRPVDVPLVPTGEDWPRAQIARPEGRLPAHHSKSEGISRRLRAEAAAAAAGVPPTGASPPRTAGAPPRTAAADPHPPRTAPAAPTPDPAPAPLAAEAAAEAAAGHGVPHFGRRAADAAAGSTANQTATAGGARGSGIVRTTVNIEPYVSVPASYLVGLDGGRRLYARAALENYAPDAGVTRPARDFFARDDARDPSPTKAQRLVLARPAQAPAPAPASPPAEAALDATQGRPASGGGGGRRRTPVRTGGFQNIDTSKL